MKFIRRDYTSANTPSTYAEVQDFMCSEIADMIVSADTGWEYDERTPNKTAFISLPNPGGMSSYPQTRYPILYLRNTISGAKLAVVSINMACYYNASTSDVISKYSPVTKEIFPKDISGYNAVIPSGIGLAMIPTGVDAEFPDSYTSSTSFADEALCFECEFSGSMYSNSDSFSNYSDYINGSMGRLIYSANAFVSYGLLVDSERVVLFSGGGTGTRPSITPVYCIGRVLGTLAYDSERPSQFYAGIRFCTKGRKNWMDATLPLNGYSYFGLPTNTTAPSLTNNYTPFRALLESFREDGTRFTGRYGVVTTYLFGNEISNGNVIRWQPGFVFKTNDVLYENGDGFKGYLDTNFIRYAIANTGQLFNDGQFCCVATNLLLKWDPDAEDTILA